MYVSNPGGILRREDPSGMGGAKSNIDGHLAAAGGCAGSAAGFLRNDRKRHRSS